MGFLDRFLGGKEQVPGVLTIQVSELDNILEKEKRSHLHSDPGTEDLAAGIKDGLSNIKSLLEKLGKSQVRSDIVPRAKSMIEGARKNYLEKTGQAIDEAEDAAQRDIYEFSSTLDNKLAEISKIDIKYGERTKAGFEKGVAEIRKSLNKIVNESRELKEALENDKGKLKVLSDATKQKKRMDTAIAKLSELEGKKRDLYGQYQEIDLTLLDHRKKIENIRNSSSAEKGEQIGRELAALEQKRKELEGQILNMLGPLKRVFKKYARIVDAAAIKTYNLEKYAKDPVETFLRGDDTLADLLAKIQKSISSKKLDMDAQESERSIKKIRNISFSYLEKIRGEYNETISRIRTLELSQKEVDISSEVQRLQRELDLILVSLEDHRKKMRAVEDAIDEKRDAISDSREALGYLMADYYERRVEII